MQWLSFAAHRIDQRADQHWSFVVGEEEIEDVWHLVDAHRLHWRLELLCTIVQRYIQVIKEITYISQKDTLCGVSIKSHFWFKVQSILK